MDMGQKTSETISVPFTVLYIVYIRIPSTGCSSNSVVPSCLDALA